MSHQKLQDVTCPPFGADPNLLSCAWNQLRPRGASATSTRFLSSFGTRAKDKTLSKLQTKPICLGFTDLVTSMAYYWVIFHYLQRNVVQNWQFNRRWPHTRCRYLWKRLKMGPLSVCHNFEGLENGIKLWFSVLEEIWRVNMCFSIYARKQ